jgi:F0F1-type ATP synthase membrane subunit b/b'
VSPVNLIPSLQSDALVREIEQQFKDEKDAIATGAKRDAHAVLAQARSAARARVSEAIAELREEGARRLTRAKAQLDTLMRARAQRQAAKAVGEAMPLLQEALEQRWRDRDSRRQWTDAVARLCTRRLRPGVWVVEHPKDWSALEQKQFTKGVGDVARLSFKAAGDVGCGLRIESDQAILDATPRGLLADTTTIAALLLNEICGSAK